MKNLIYDGKMDNGDIISHFFVSEDIEHAADLFEYLYEEDIEDFAAERVEADVYDYEVEGCSLCLNLHAKNRSLESATLTATVIMNGETMELEPAEIDLDENALHILLCKID